MRHQLALGLTAALFVIAVSAGEAQQPPVVVVDPGHDLRANSQTSAARRSACAAGRGDVMSVTSE